MSDQTSSPSESIHGVDPRDHVATALRDLLAGETLDLHGQTIVARADIPSDGVWHTVTVVEIPVGLRTEYVCVPSVEQTVYATVVLSNATDQALRAGPVEVMSGDDFLTTAALPTLAPGGVRRMGLGPAEGVRVTRRTQLHEPCQQSNRGFAWVFPGGGTGTGLPRGSACPANIAAASTRR